MIAVVKYNAGNIRSVLNALHRIGAEGVLTSDPGVLTQADKVIFPGVGEASTTMTHLRSLGLDSILPNIQRPFLGICLGLQLMCRHSEEGDTTCLGIFNEDVKRFPATGKVPHMGWNTIDFDDSGLFRGLPVQSDVYFVHSYYAETGPDTSASTDYLIPFSAAMHRDNFYAVQFHPEKSATIGEQILKNFLEL